MFDRRAVLGGMAAAPLLGSAARAEAAAGDAALAAVFADSGAPALVGAVVTADGFAWRGVAGVRRAGLEAQATLDDKWHLGSNTKAMTSALYARLVEQGRAKWGATVPELFPDLQIDPAWAQTTIEQLMSHRTGLLDSAALGMSWLIRSRSDERPLPEQRTALAERVFAAPPAGAPGEFSYSNAGYTLVGAAIERLTGQAWEAAIEQELFAPAGITSAGFGAPLGEQPWGHVSTPAMAPRPVDPAGVSDNPQAMAPAGTAHMTLDDYARFVRLFLTDGGGMLSPDSVRKLITPVEGADYALGWISHAERPWARGRAIAHEGSNTMWHAFVAAAPERGLAVITASNDHGRGGPACSALAMRLIQAYAAA